MVVMGGIALAFAWYTTSTRRARDHMVDLSDSDTVRPIVVAPKALPALAYLPADVNAIVDALVH